MRITEALRLLRWALECARSGYFGASQIEALTWAITLLEPYVELEVT